MEPPTKNLGCSLAERPIKSEIVQRLDKARKMRDEKKKKKNEEYKQRMEKEKPTTKLMTLIDI